MGQQHTRQLHATLDGGPSAPLPLHGSRLCSLWDIMEKFNVKEVADALGSLGALLHEEPWANLPEELFTALLKSALIKTRKALIQISGDPSLIEQVEFFQGRLEEETPAPRYETLRAQILVIYQGLRNNLGSQLFMHVPADQAAHYNNRKILGAAVRDFFPASSLEEIVLAGNCYAAGLWTASVFHSMRFAEHGLRKLARSVGVKLTDNKKPIPLEYATWNKVIDGLRSKISAERKKNKNATVERRMAWFASIADHCEYMKDIWRNSVAHSGRRYSKPEALAALDRVRDFSQKLVAGVPR